MWSSIFGSDQVNYANEVTFTLNGESVTVGSELADGTSLNSYIRDVAKLTGTKNLCFEGECGACIVAAAFVHPVSKIKKTIAINSCLVPVLNCHGWEITTVEGLGNRFDGYHPVQATLAQFNGTQCGFCTPGMVMNMYSLMEDKKPTMAEVENSFGGNLCRCTGYRSVLDAFKSLSTDASVNLKNACSDIEDLYKICSKTGQACSGNCKKPTSDPIHVGLKATNWYKVNTLDQLFATLNVIGDVPYKLVAGNTAEGYYRSFGIQAYIDIKDIAELRTISSSPKVTIGANMTLTETMENFRAVTTQGYSYLKQLADHIDKIANVPVNNIGTLAGNLSMKKEHSEFPSDVYLILETVGATLSIRDSSGSISSVNLATYLTMDMKKKVIVNIVLPTLTNLHQLKTFKIMQRAQCTKGYVIAGFLIQVQDTVSWKVVGQPRIVFGGINPTFNRATNTETYLFGKNLLDPATVSGVQTALGAEIIPDYVPPNGVPEYRKPLAQALFYKFLLGLDPSKVDPKNRSGADNLVRALSSGLQDFQTDPNVWPLNQPIPKLDALAQCSGEAEFLDDIPSKPGELHAALVLTKFATGTITKIDPAPALAIEEVVAFYKHTDIPGTNNFMPLGLFTFVEEEEIFCSGNVKYAGQVVGIVVAKTRTVAMQAAGAVLIEYTNVTKPILSIDDVLSPTKDRVKQSAKKGDMPTPKPKATHTLNGTFEIGKQFHLAMETQGCLVEPTEDGYEIHSSTQWMDLIQVVVAKTIQVPVNTVNVHVRRIGGGFGGKQTRPALLAGACAVAAQKLKKPVRLVLPLQTNMESMGKRFAQRHEYQVGFDDNGVIESVTSHITQDSGCSNNESALGIAIIFFNSCYDVSKYEIDGHEVLTDTASNTPCRGPGPIEGIAFHDEIMERIAKYLNKDPLDVKLANMTKDDNPLPVLLNELKQQASYDERKQIADSFNANNRWKKRGLSILPIRYPQMIWANFNSLVSIYHGDGTVGITHGGIEMGQGLNTKLSQVAAHTLGLPLHMIKIKPSSTVTAANAMVSGGSIVSEGASLATVKSCEELLRRLEPIRASMNNPTWQQLVQQAYIENVDLSATYMFSKKDELKDYNIWGAAIAEVEVDILTGEKQILRVDLVEDVGQSLSPLIDVGQIEGAFVMGIGYWLCEEIQHDTSNGRLLNRSTKNYKAPGPKDIPADFRVHFRKDSPNLNGLLGSKTTGEPAICMSASVWFAIRNALDSARKDAGDTGGYFDMKHPASNEHIFLSSMTSPGQFQL